MYIDIVPNRKSPPCILLRESYREGNRVLHRTPNRMRAHAFIGMLAYYVEWHMHQNLALILFDDDRQTAETLRDSVVAPAQPSPTAARKARRKATENGQPVHSFRTLLEDLATIVKNRLTPKLARALRF